MVFTRAGSVCSAAQRSSWSVSSASRSAGRPLTRGVFEEVHGRSAGCSSGVEAGKGTRWTCAGITTRSLWCYPARSSTTTSCLSGSAPACCAKAASEWVKSSTLTPEHRCHWVRPEAGWTSPHRDRQRERGWITTTGRCPRGAHTRRRIGLSPMRCSSVAQTSTAAVGCSACTVAPLVSSFFSRPFAPRGWPLWYGAAAELAG
jgi:hypothetical protein